MKQETQSHLAAPPPPPTTPTTKSECKTSSSMSQCTTPSRLRASSKAKDSPKPETGNGILSPALKARPKSVPSDVKSNSKTRKSLLPNKPKSGEDVVGSQKGRELEEVRVVGRSGNRPVMEQFARPRRQRPTADSGLRRNEDGTDDEKKNKEFQEKLELNDTLIKNLQSEVLGLKAELDKAQSFNVELQSQNRKLTVDLAAADAKIAALSSSRDQKGSIEEYQIPKFKDIQKLIANKLEHSKIKKEAINEASIKTPPPASIYPISKAENVESKAPSYPSLPPPPPPPLPPRHPARAAATRKAPAIVEFYHSLTKQEGKRDPTGPGNHNKPMATSAHSSIVGEIQNRSAHLLAIKADIETKGEFINGLIQKVLAAAYTDIEDVLRFVDWLDSELSSLADERSVLKHFKWPERKADAMREAAIEYRDLKLLESEISSHKDDTSIPCGAALKKMASLLDKSEQRIQKLIKLRNSVMHSYQDYKIPTDWMLDSGVVSRIKQASMKLAKMYMKRVTMELESVRYPEKEATQEALLLQGVHFAYRAHQFAGGLDSETLCAFEEIRQRVPGNPAGSRELLVGIPST